MKTTFTTALAALGLAAALSTPAMSAPLSANGAVTTNYIFRGISQSGSQSAVSAGLDYDLGSGFSVGAWASSIDFGHVNGEDTPMELDIYGGYNGQISDELGYGVGVITYNYPNAPHGVNYNWEEVWGSLTYNFGPAAVTGKIYYSPDYVNLGASQTYFNGAISIPIAPWLSLNGSFGYTSMEKAVAPIIKSYTDYSIGVAATFDAYTVTLGYTNTDLSGIYKVKSGPFQTNQQFFGMISFKLP